MKRILQVLHSLAGGGIENLLQSYLSHMNRDGLQFDFVVYGDTPGALEPWFESVGCRIFHVPHRHDGLKRHCERLEAVIRDGHYDIVHSHQSEKGFLTLRIAKKLGVRTRVLHVHNAYPPETPPQKLLRAAGAAFGKRYATDLFACGRDAGTWLYGERAMRSGKVRILPNAIDLERFAYDPAARDRIRKELDLSDRFVIGSVARFTEQKNHAFLLDIFKLVSESRPDALLLLAGEGELFEDTKKRAAALGLGESVRFLGVRTDVPALLQGMDAFALPSRFEGLGIVFLEAQAAGLPTFGPDIPGARDTAVTDLMRAFRPNEPAQAWAQGILAQAAAQGERADTRAALIAAGYDIRTQARVLEQFYKASR